MIYDRSQLEAIQHVDGPCQVLAGPGSGKTMTIVGRIKYLIEEVGIEPKEILVITFSRAAAKEMEQRFRFHKVYRNVSVNFGTFHGVFYGILRESYRFTTGNILSEKEKYRLLSEVLRGIELQDLDTEDFLKDLLSDISIVKNNCCNLEEYEPKSGGKDTFIHLYQAYEEARRAIKKIDFDDMLVLCHELFQKKPEVLAKWQKRFSHILVDEFQDINQVQYEVLKALAAPQNNLFVVGDDDQSIYGFRGASADLMFSFQKDYPKGKEVQLTLNYRSPKGITASAAKVIGHNKKRFSKNIQSAKNLEAKIYLEECVDEEAERDFLLKEIKSRIRKGVPYEEIAVLFRVHQEAEILVEKLLEQEIPFQIKEKLKNSYEHFVGQDILAYLRLSVSFGEKIEGKKRGLRRDMLQIMNKPLRYISREAIDKEVDFELIRDYYEEKEWMLDRIDILEVDLKILKAMTPYAATQYIRKKIGYDEYLLEEYGNKPALYQQAKDILIEMENAAKRFSNIPAWLTHIEEYAAFLEYQQEKSTPKEGVVLSTIHGSKGLEFDTVLLMSANEGILPFKRAIKYSIEEERRLFYVAMTRAKAHLAISYLSRQKGQEIAVSRFVEEMELVR